MRQDEFDFANDIKAAHLERAPSFAWLTLAIISVIILAGLIWAKLAVLDEVTTGSGRVIPSSQMQVVQTLEGGIVREILIREGDTVKKIRSSCKLMIPVLPPGWVRSSNAGGRDRQKCPGWKPKQRALKN